MIGATATFLIGKDYGDVVKFGSDNKNVVIEDFIESTLSEDKECSLSRNVVLIANGKMIPIFVTSSPVKNYSAL
jgi:hypothetical protein